MKSYKARGIVLHTVKYGESSMVVYMLTDTYGRQTYIVQGVRSSKGKGNKAAMFQPMFAVDFVGLESPKMEMHRMKDVRNALVLTSIPFDVRKSTVSLFIAEVLYRVVREVEPNSPLFDFVLGSIEALDALTNGTANFHLWFLVKLSFFMGFYPGNEYSEGAWFDIQEGLFTPVMPTHGMTMDRDSARLLHRFMEADMAELGNIKLAREQRSAFMTAVLNYFGYHLNSINNVRSIQILRDVF